jgi:hypothetical protein
MSELKIEQDLSQEAGATGAAMNADAKLAPHLFRLGHTDWALWRWAGLRGAGFAVDEMERLRSPGCAAAADELIEAEADFESARKAAAQALRQELERAEPEVRAALEKALRRVQKGKSAPPLEQHAPPAADTMLDRLRAEKQRVDAARLDFNREFEVATAQTSRALREVANWREFQEAVIWQNRHAFHTGITSLLRKSPEDTTRGSKRRQHEDLIASYLQRYCLKNDTIGFFGPVGWAHLVQDGPAMSSMPGPQLLAERRVYFEMWGIDALGAALEADARVQVWVAPRRMPFARLEGGALHVANREPIKLSAAQQTLWLACDGVRTPKAMVEEVCAGSGGEVWGEEQVYKMLRQMKGAGLLKWTLESGISQHPERGLRRQLELIGDEQVRAESLAKLDALEAARVAVAGAAGHPPRLDAALGALEETFSRFTGVEATRSAGRTYGGRTLVYEDCRRDMRVEIGPEAVEELGRPLSLLLESARWFTHAVAEDYRAEFDRLFDELSRISGPTVEFLTFWLKIRSRLFDPNDPLINRVAQEFQTRWAEILQVPADAASVHHLSEELRPRVLAAFGAPQSGWMFARYHNPDVLIAATDIEAVRRGDYQFVMGELHIGANTLGVPLFLEQHESQAEVLAAVELDMPTPRLFPLIPKSWTDVSPRLLPVLKTSKDFFLEMEPGDYDSPPSRTLAISSLVIRRDEGGRLLASTRDGKVRFDIIEAFALAISTQVINRFKVLRAARRTPRVTIDRLVVARRAWHFAPGELRFAVEREASGRLLEARRWAKSAGLPQRVFVKATVELKPFFVDFASLPYVENLARVVRRCQEAGEGHVSVTEMLPEPEESWLTDAVGRHYTSELRLVAMNLRDRERGDDGSWRADG